MSRWSADDVRIELDLELTEGGVVTIVAETPVGSIALMADLVELGRRLVVLELHVQGPHAHVVGRRGLLAIAQAVMELADVDEILLQGGLRTSGAGKGRRPGPILLRRRPR